MGKVDILLPPKPTHSRLSVQSNAALLPQVWSERNRGGRICFGSSHLGTNFILSGRGRHLPQCAPHLGAGVGIRSTPNNQPTLGLDQQNGTH